MEIFIIRHGETNYNLKGLISDSPLENVFLTKLGKEQAKIIANKLKNKHFEAIYISEFHRVKQTAEIINESHKLQIKIDKRLNENKTGLNGEHVEKYINEILKHKDFWNLRLKDGESFADIQKRIYEFITDLKKKKYNKVLIIAHASTIKFFNGYFKKLSNNEIFNHKDIKNCEVFKFKI